MADFQHATVLHERGQIAEAMAYERIEPGQRGQWRLELMLARLCALVYNMNTNNVAVEDNACASVVNVPCKPGCVKCQYKSSASEIVVIPN